MEKSEPAFIIGIPVYQGVDLLDVTAPYEVFNWMAQKLKGTRDVRVYLVAESNGIVVTRDGLQLVPHKTFDQVARLDLLWVPGADPAALKERMGDAIFLRQLRAWSEHAAYVASVCEGALLLASAGLLDGYRATTHWAFLACLRQFPKIEVVGGDPDYPRFVIDPEPGKTPRRGTRVTGAGISSGLDEALKLVEMIGGRALAEDVQATIQYFPKPPVHGKIPGSAQCPLDGIG